jgi:hypothetical protein
MLGFSYKKVTKIFQPHFEQTYCSSNAICSDNDEAKIGHTFPEALHIYNVNDSQ